jgi:hypothetical protein
LTTVPHAGDRNIEEGVFDNAVPLSVLAASAAPFLGISIDARDQFLARFQLCT